MLKPGLVYIGQPSIHLHEMICLALYLEAPLALSDKQSLEIAQKFSGLITVFELSRTNTLNHFISGLKELYTNLQPYELEPFFLAYPEHKKIKVYHLLESAIALKPCNDRTTFCSSFNHLKKLVPLNADFLSLGPIGYLSFKKHQKALEKIFYSFLDSNKEGKFLVAQILNDAKGKKIESEQTLDQIHFINLAFSGFEDLSKTHILPAHGLIDVACQMLKINYS
jgi:hypothetical protein